MRTYRRLQVRLSKGDREKLDAMLSGGVQAVRTVLRALVLRRLDEGRSAAEVATEIGLFARQCLGHRRIPDLKTLRREARAWTRRINRARTRINWRFDRRAARRKFGYVKHFSKRSET